MTKESKTEAHVTPPKIDDRMSPKGFPWTTSAAVASLSAFSFATAAAGEWAYYLGLGALDFLSLATPADYASGALLWLPVVLLGVATGYFSGQMTLMLTLLMPAEYSVVFGHRACLPETVAAPCAPTQYCASINRSTTAD